MKEMSIFRNFLPARSDNWPRKWRAQRPLPNTSDRSQVTYLQHKYILCATNVPNFWLAKKSFDLQKQEKLSDKCIRCDDTSHAKGFQCPAKSFSVKCVINSATSHQSVTKRTNRHQAHLSLGNLRHTNLEQGPYTPIKKRMALYLKSQVLMNHSAYR